MSATSDGVNVGRDLNLSASPLFARVAKGHPNHPLARLADPVFRADLGVGESEIPCQRFPNRAAFQALGSAVAGLVGGGSGTLVRDVDDGACRIFTPTVSVGSWTGSNWSPAIAKAADLFPDEITNANAIQTDEAAMDAFAAILKHVVTLRNMFPREAFTDCDMGFWLAEAMDWNVDTFAAKCYPYAGGDGWPWWEDLTPVPWFEQFGSSPCLVALLRAAADLDAKCVGYLSSSAIDEPAECAAVFPRLAQAFAEGCGFGGTYDTARLDGFLWAATNAALARIAPFGMFALNPTYNADPVRNRLAVTHSQIGRTYSYSVTYPLTDVTFNEAGDVIYAPPYDPSRFVIAYDKGSEASWKAEPEGHANRLDWSYAENGGNGKSGKVQFRRALELLLCEYSQGFGIRCVGLDMTKAELEELARDHFGADSKVIMKGEVQFPFAEGEVFAVRMAPRQVMEFYKFADAASHYVSGPYFSVVGCEATSLTKSFSAEAPSETPTEHGVDLTGLAAYPCAAARTNGYARETGTLASCWRGKTEIESGEHSPSLCVLKGDLTLGSADANVATVRTDHLDRARLDQERIITTQVRALLNDATAKVVRDRDAIKAHINAYADVFPSLEDIKALLPPNDSTTLDGLDWTPEGYPYAWAFFSTRTVDAGGEPGTLGVFTRLVSSSESGDIDQCESLTEQTEDPYVIGDRADWPLPPVLPTDWEKAANWKAERVFRGFLGAFDWYWRALSTR